MFLFKITTWNYLKFHAHRKVSLVFIAALFSISDSSCIMCQALKLWVVSLPLNYTNLYLFLTWHCIWISHQLCCFSLPVSCGLVVSLPLCHWFRWTDEPQKHRWIHWIYVAIYSLEAGTYISGKESAILYIQLPVSHGLKTNHCHWFRWTSRSWKHR